MDTLNKVCFTICIVCIVVGAVLGLAMVWWEAMDNAIMGKVWLSTAILFVSSALTLSAARTLAPRSPR